MPRYSLKRRWTLLLSVVSLFLVIIIPAICLADAEKIFSENTRAVVFIIAYDETGEAIRQGSGFIVRRDGVIVTNYHVVSSASSIKIKTGTEVLNVNGLIYLDKENDIAILKVDAKNLSIVKLGNLDKTNIGEKVYVIGSPKGFENTISDGILSGKRKIALNKMLLQITAPVSPGSSGGPVFNKNGEVIGIVTYLIEEAQNLNFAMSLDVIQNEIASNKVTPMKKSKIDDYQKTAEYWFHLGVAYIESGKYREAVEACKQAIRVKPDYADAYYFLGHAYFMLDLNKEAVEACKQAIRVKPDYIEAWNCLGSAYDALGIFPEAVEASKQAIRINPDDSYAYSNLGFAYDGLGRYPEAVEACKHAIRFNPDNAEAHYYLGVAYANLNRYREAAEACKQAIRINPDYTEAHYNLGVAYANLNRYREAAEAYKQAIRIKPGDALPYFSLGMTYLLLKDKGAALDQYKVLKKLDTDMAEKLFNFIYK